MEYIKGILRFIAISLVLFLALALLSKIIPPLRPLVQKIDSIAQHKVEMANKNDNDLAPAKNTPDNRYELLWATKSLAGSGTNSEQLDVLTKVFIEFNNKNNSGITNKFSCNKFEEVSAPVKKFIDQLPVADPSDFTTRDTLSTYSSSVSYAISFCKSFSDMGPQAYTYSLLSVKIILEYLNWYRALKIYEESGSTSAEEGYIVHKWEKLFTDSSNQLKAIAKKAADQASKPITIPTIAPPQYTSPALGNTKTICTSKQNWKGEIETTCSESSGLR